MRIAISLEGNKIESLIDQRFGRCKYFLIVDIEDKKITNLEVKENQGAIQGHGAGISAAQQLGDLKVEVLITGNLGPNATQVLEQLEIKTYQASGIAKEAVEKFIENKLNELTKTSKAHSGITEVNNERVFIPLLNNSGMDSEIATHFGHAPFFGLYDFETKKFTITKNVLDHSDPNSSPVDQIAETFNPTIVFAQSMGERAIGLFNEKGIKLKTGPYKTVKEAIENLNKLKELTQSCGH
jgi:predicted Fe-Mo cluster-binding NifX family protein